MKYIDQFIVSEPRLGQSTHLYECLIKKWGKKTKINVFQQTSSSNGKTLAAATWLTSGGCSYSSISLWKMFALCLAQISSYANGPKLLSWWGHSFLDLWFVRWLSNIAHWRTQLKLDDSTSENSWRVCDKSACILERKMTPHNHNTAAGFVASHHKQINSQQMKWTDGGKILWNKINKTIWTPSRYNDLQGLLPVWRS